MPGNPHPAEAPFDAHSADDIIAFVKQYERITVADANEVRNTYLFGQFAGIYVRSNRTRYDLDLDSTAIDDGTNCIIDGGGQHFVKISEGQGDPVVALYTNSNVSGGAITIGDDVDRALFNVTVPVSVHIPAAASRNDRTLLLKDIGGGAASANITPVFNGTETCDGLTGASFAITAAYGSVLFAPKTGGYYQAG